MSAVTIPEAADLKPLLADLIGKDVSFGQGGDPAEPATIEGQLTLYVGDGGQPFMLAGGDAAFAHLAGAALALVPKARAEDAVASGQPDDDLLENYREIMNVVTRVVNDQGGPHVRLVPGSSVSLSELPTPSAGRCSPTSIENYGDGTLSVWVF